MEKKLENIKLRSEQVQDILSYVPHWMIRYGNILFLVLIIMFLMLSWLIKYPDIITSEALLTSEIPPQKEFAKITAKIDTILIENGQNIKENDVLAILENTANYNDILLLKKYLNTTSINKNSFYFPIDSLPILFLGDIDTAFAIFENNYSQYVLNKTLQPFSNEALSNKNSLSELYRRLDNSKAQLNLNHSELMLSKKDLDRNKTLLDKGIISQLDYEKKQIQFAQSKRSYKSLEASISQIRQSISNADKNSKANKINRTKEEIRLFKNVIQSYNQLKKALKNWEHSYVLKSNINGTVSFMHYWNINQTVNSGDLVFTIIPNKNSSFIAKLKTPLTNSGKLKIGQVVNISLQNYPEIEFGVLKGNINYISSIPDNEGFYLLDVKLPKKLITTYNKHINFKHEMIGNAEIITEDLRLSQRFLYQLKGIFDD